MNVLELLGQFSNKASDFLGVTDVQLDGQHLNAITDFLLDLLFQLFQGFQAAGCHDELQVLWAGTGEFEGGAATNA